MLSLVSIITESVQKLSQNTYCSEYLLLFYKSYYLFSVLLEQTDHWHLTNRISNLLSKVQHFYISHYLFYKARDIITKKVTPDGQMTTYFDM